MKSYHLLLIIVLLFRAGLSAQGLAVVPCASNPTDTASYTKASALRQVMGQLTAAGVPGAAIMVYSAEGWWSSAAGYAKIEEQIPLQTCHLQYLQSISKTYMAAGILKLYEQGKIDLDASMAVYLPDWASRHITDAEKISVRMLLNHTSGIPEYNTQPAYVTRLLQHPDYPFVPEDYLRYISGKPLDFVPGSRFSYRNTNYVLLALIADAITGDHAQFLADAIFEPLGLSSTYYRGAAGYLAYPQLANSYWDRYSTGVLENASVLQRNNVAMLVGDDGIVATPQDAVKFLRGLMEGNLLSQATLGEMKEWVADSKGAPTYGLGLDYVTFHGVAGYGHSGGGLGAGCQLYYFPQKNIYIFAGINLGTVTGSPIHAEAEKLVDQLYKVLLE